MVALRFVTSVTVTLPICCGSIGCESVKLGPAAVNVSVWLLLDASLYATTTVAPAGITELVNVMVDTVLMVNRLGSTFTPLILTAFGWVPEGITSVSVKVGPVTVRFCVELSANFTVTVWPSGVVGREVKTMLETVLTVNVLALTGVPLAVTVGTVPEGITSFSAKVGPEPINDCVVLSAKVTTTLPVGTVVKVMLETVLMR